MVKYAPILVGLLLALSGCSGPAGPDCSSDDDCSSGERCLSSGGLFFGSAYCVPTGAEPINNTQPDMGMTSGPDCQPGFEEAVCDLLDGDGDGVVDEGCPCEFSESTEGVCAQATRDCLGECVAPEGYEEDEVTCDGIDNDCDGMVDEGIPFAGTVVAAGDSHTCALDAEGAVYCWGRNNRGQLGVEGPDTAVPTALDISVPLDSLDAGDFHTCGVSNQSGAIYCWGANDTAQTDPANADIDPSTGPVRIDPPNAMEPWTFVTAGVGYTCGISAGTVYCWGLNDFGQTGNLPTTDPVLAPTPIDAPDTILFDRVDAGAQHACATSTAKDGYCWGSSADDRLSRMVTEAYGPPGRIQVRNDENLNLQIDHFSTGYDHTCATATIGVDPLDVTGVTCNGVNTFGQLGGTPRPDIVETNAIGPSSGGNGFACSYRADRGVDCWGKNDLGQLGRPPAATLGVGRVEGLDVGGNAVRGLSAGARHACAVLDSGIFCWGDNEFGQLGTDVARPGTTAVSCTTASPTTN